MARFSLWCAMAAALSLAQSAAIGDGPTPESLPLATWLDDETTAYLYQMSLDEVAAKTKAAPFGRMLADPQVRAFFDELERLGRRKDGFAPLVRFVLAALRAEFVVAARAGPTGGGQPDSQPADARPSAELGLLRPGPQDTDALRRLYSEAIDGWSGTTRQIDVAGQTFQVLGSEESGIYTRWTDERFAWAVGRGGALWSLRPAAQKPLAQSPLFRDAVGPLLKGQRDGPIALYYHDLRPAWERLTQGDAALAWNKSAWRSLDAVAGATFVEGELLRNRHYWRFGEQRVGFLEHTRAARLRREWLERVPADASGFTTGVLDAHTAITSIFALPAAAAGQADSTLAMVGLGLAAIDPLLQRIGPRYLLYRLPGRYGQYMMGSMVPLHDSVIFLELRDAEETGRLLDESLRSSGMLPLTTASFGSHRVGCITLLYFNVFYTRADDTLIVTMHPQLMKDALEMWDEPRRPITGTEAFRSIGDRIPEDSCFLTYFPPGGFARGIYDNFSQFFGMAQLAGMYMWDSGLHAPDGPASQGFEPFVLPRGSDLAKYATAPTYLAAVDDGRGVLFDGTAPLLCTPRYWCTIQALGRLQPEGVNGMAQIASYLFASTPEAPGASPGEDK